MKNSLKLEAKQRRFQMNKKAFIFMAVMCMGIGFAFLSSNLTITGNTSVSGNKWNVYFTNVQVSENSVEATVAPTTTGTNTTSIDYTVTLDNPGDFYEFTVEAKNDGSIDAMIESISMTSLSTDVAKYLSYTATYEDGIPLAENDVLKAKTSTTYIIRAEYKKDISASDLDEEGVDLTLSFGVNYVQSTITDAVDSVFAKIIKDSAVSDSSIDFTQISSSSNGRGLYVRNGTENSTYPIYYYRGNVNNNNAKFAGFCWKIVRTTETGGTKLLYNGVPNASGECSNTTGTSTQLATTSEFNPNYNSPAYNGYMYGTVYEMDSRSHNDSYVYGSNFTYENGNYTLSDLRSEADSTHHYTCFNDTGVCSTLAYVYYVMYVDFYISLTDGKSVEDALREMNTNDNDSSVKAVVDNWFNTTFKNYFIENNKNYKKFLEDTVWCNDRSANTIDVTVNSWDGTSSINSGWKSDGGSIDDFLWYGAYGRLKSGAPSLICPNKNDSFTVEESETGNGALTYPVGLLTSDEIMLAGGQNDSNTDYYLSTNNAWWLLSPYQFRDNFAFQLRTASNGYLEYSYANSNLGVRPSISLKPGVKIAEGGDGTSATPYEFIVG